MTNGGIIEGNTEYSGFSDLSLVISYAGQWFNMPKFSRFEERFQIFGGSGVPLGAERLQKPDIEKEARLRTQHITFGSGETCMQMRVASGGVKGLSEVCATSLPMFFMKHLVLLIVGASISYGQSFNGTAFDLETGRIQIITGSIDQSRVETYQEIMDSNREVRSRLRANTDRMWDEIAASRVRAELEEQTRLLRKIANE